MQRCSKVEDDTLRFDFSHKQGVKPDELSRIEQIINQRIVEGAIVRTDLMDIKAARQLGAMALFGEKYPDRVRVVQMGDFSTELCGGTHITNTGQVGLCKIIHEEPVAKGVRRIVAYTGNKALQRIREHEQLLHDLSLQLKTPRPQDLLQKISSLQEELQQAKMELSRHTQQSVEETVQQLAAQAESVNDVKIIIHQPENADRDVLRNYADQLRSKLAPVALLLAAEIDGKVAFLAAVSNELVSQGVSASDCVKAAAKVARGGGGGRPDLAEAGAKDPSKLAEALQVGAEFYRKVLQSI